MSIEPYIGQISMTGFNWAPRGWALCNGQPLSIAQNTALYSLIGVTYGGNGTTTFNLPNLQGRAPLHWGTGNGLSFRQIGEVAGSENVTLVNNQMPAHNHLVNVNTNDATGKNPANMVLASSGTAIYATGGNGNTLNPQTIGPAGGGQPHPNMQPYLVINFIIALEGIFPSRN